MVFFVLFFLCLPCKTLDFPLQILFYFCAVYHSLLLQGEPAWLHILVELFESSACKRFKSQKYYSR